MEISVLPPYLLVELEPGGEALLVHVLESKEPHLPQTDGLHHLHQNIYLSLL